MKLTRIFKKWRVILLVIVLLLSYLIISPSFSSQGVAIKNIEQNSSASTAGMQGPSATATLKSREKILAVENTQIKTLDDYAKATSIIPLNRTLRIYTDKNPSGYVLLKDSEDLGVVVEEAATSNLKKGLELQGGTRVLLQPVEKISDQQRDDLIAVMENRLNTYGLSDIRIRKADDLLGNKYIVVEIAGASKQDVKDLIESQGKFEAKIGNELVFTGGKEDITFVCRNDGTCSGIRQCNPGQNGYFCEFEFTIRLSPTAAKRHAEVTKDIPLNTTSQGGQILSKNIDFYLDDKLVDSLQIAASLKGVEATQIAISGPGLGATQDEAIQTALKSMNRLQTILITGSLPSKLEIIKIDSISPLLGKDFTRNAMIAGLLALAMVALVMFVKYRKLKITIPIMITSLSEVTIILAIYALFKANLDLSAIAGIVVAVGTGVNDQIVITDEFLAKETQYLNWRQRIKRAFFIILSAYAVGVASMLPLLRAGAGLLTGFALTTIIGITAGVLITRPAYGAAVEVLLSDER